MRGNNMKVRFLIVFVMLLINVNSFCYEPAGVRFLTENYGQRAYGMGGAFTAVSDDTSAVFYNPAGLIQVESIQIEITGISLDLDRSYMFIGYAEPVPYSKKTVFGAAMLTYTVDDIKGYDEDSYEMGTFDITSQALVGSIAYRASKNFSAGLNLKFIEEDLWINSGNCVSFDLGALYWAKNYKIGLMAKDLSSEMSWTSGYKEEIPITFRLGAAYDQSEYITYALDFEKRKDMPIKIFLGGEYHHKDYFGNLGFGDGLFSFGVGGIIHVRSVGDFLLGYAYRTEKEGYGSSNSLSLSYQKYKKKKKR